MRVIYTVHVGRRCNFLWGRRGLAVYKSSVEVGDGGKNGAAVLSSRTLMLQVETMVFMLACMLSLPSSIDAAGRPRKTKMRFYLNNVMKGDYHRYLAEFKTGVERREATENTMAAYEVDQEIATRAVAGLPRHHRNQHFALPEFSGFVSPQPLKNLAQEGCCDVLCFLCNGSLPMLVLRPLLPSNTLEAVLLPCTRSLRFAALPSLQSRLFSTVCTFCQLAPLVPTLGTEEGFLLSPTKELLQY